MNLYNLLLIIYKYYFYKLRNLYINIFLIIINILILYMGLNIYIIYIFN